jgi:flagellar biosynthesis protein FlhA
LPGVETTDPAFGLPAIWIDASAREQAQAMGYTVVDAGTVIATHLNHLITTHAAELLGRQEVQQLLDHLAKEMPKMVEDLVPKLIPLSVLQKSCKTCCWKAYISVICVPLSRPCLSRRCIPRMPMN